MNKNVAVIGFGKIGPSLYKRLVRTGYNVPFIVISSGIYEPRLGRKIGERSDLKAHLNDVDVACLTISTKDNGETARDYILEVLSLGIPIVICEKGALSNFYSELKPYLNRIGYSATVGGGSGLLKLGKRAIALRKVEEIHAIVNASLNYFPSEYSINHNSEEVFQGARELNYVEPGAKTILEAFNIEANCDVPRKTAILFNVFGLGEIRARDIKTSPISEETLRELLRQSENRRHVVSIRRKHKEEDCIAGFRYNVNGWHISAGFKNITDDRVLQRLKLSGAISALMVCESRSGLNGPFFMCGQGAGPQTTVASMIDDLEELIKGEAK